MSENAASSGPSAPTHYCWRCGSPMTQVDKEPTESTQPRVRWEDEHGHWEQIGFDLHEET